jgi:hypothetical protein
MRTNATIKSFAVLAVPAQHLKYWWISISPAPLIGSRSRTTVTHGAKYLPTPISAVVVDVIESQERQLRISAAGTSTATVGHEHLYFDSLSAISLVLRNCLTVFPLFFLTYLSIASIADRVPVAGPSLPMEIHKRNIFAAPRAFLAILCRVFKKTGLANHTALCFLVELRARSKILTHQTSHRRIQSFAPTLGAIDTVSASPFPKCEFYKLRQRFGYFARMALFHLLDFVRRYHSFQHHSTETVGFTEFTPCFLRAIARTLATVLANFVPRNGKFTVKLTVNLFKEDEVVFQPHQRILGNDYRVQKFIGHLNGHPLFACSKMSL